MNWEAEVIVYKYLGFIPLSTRFDFLYVLILTNTSQLLQDHEAFDEDTPSAPPFLDSDGPVKQEEHQQPSNPSHTSLRSNSGDFEANPTIERKTPSVDLKDNHKHDTVKPSNGYVHNIFYKLCINIV